MVVDSESNSEIRRSGKFLLKILHVAVISGGRIVGKPCPASGRISVYKIRTADATMYAEETLANPEGRETQFGTQVNGSLILESPFNPALSVNYP